MVIFGLVIIALVNVRARCTVTEASQFDKDPSSDSDESEMPQFGKERPYLPPEILANIRRTKKGGVIVMGSLGV